MHFLDPYQLLQLTVASPSDVTPALLTAAQQQLEQTIQNAKDEVLLVGGKAIHKTDARTLSQAMNDPDARVHFWEMRQLHGLIPYLEGEKTAALQQLVTRSQSMGASFYEFASQWIARRLNRQIGDALRSLRWAEAVVLARHISQLHPGAEDLALEEAIQFFETRRAAIDQLAMNPTSNLTEDSLKKYHLPVMLGALNALPLRAQGLRDAYALSLGTLVMNAAAQNKGLTWTYVVTQSINMITTTDTNKQKLKFIGQRVKEDSGVEEAEARQLRRYKNSAIWAGIAGVIVLILRILMAFLT